jgi:uncharacterized protein (TIGR02145 family)
LSANLRAQVTICGLTAPKAGALLDLNSTTPGGLVLSNVDLDDLGKIPANRFVGISAAQDRNLELAGMIVYNTKATTGIGVHVWDGDDWIKPCAPPAPGQITFSGTSFCGASTFTARINSVKGATSYVWSLPAGLTGSSNDTIITINGAVGTYPGNSITVRSVSLCGAGTRRASTQAIVINALPAAPTNPSSNSGASGTSIAFSASVPTGHVIDWYDAANGGTEIQHEATSFSKTLTTTTTYYAESRNSTTGCVSATRLAVTGRIIITGCDALPATPIITSLNVEFVSEDTTVSRNGIIFSAPVRITGKGSKTSFSTSTSSIDYRDHSINSNYGSLFTWCMVARYADVLCPGEWRVPSSEDFCLYANGDKTNTAYNYEIKGQSINGSGGVDGWLLGGFATAGSGIVGQVTVIGNYWSSTPDGQTSGYSVDVYSDFFYPLGNASRNFGYSLRCVR